MKANIIYTAAFAFAAVLAYLPADAQSGAGFGPEGVVLEKNVIEGAEPNTYTINLEAFVTGESIESEVVTSAPCDFLLVLDYSGSMTDDYRYGGTFNEPVRTTYTWNNWDKDGWKTGKKKFSWNGSSYQVNIQKSSNYLRSDVSNYCYFAYIEKDGVRYYLTPDGDAIKAAFNGNMDGDMMDPANHPRGVNGEKIFPAFGTTEPLFAEITYQSTKAGSRILALKEAVCNFIDLVNADAAKNNVEHRIGIVEFESDKYPKFKLKDADKAKYLDPTHINYLRPIDGSSTYKDSNTPPNTYFCYNDDKDATGVLKMFTPVTTQNIDAIKGSLTRMNPGGSTATDRGLTIGKALIDAQKRSDENVGKVVILFSDGKPQNDGAETATAKLDEFADNAVKAAKALKDAGYKVYSVGILSSSETSRSGRILNAISSNFPNATKYKDALDNKDTDGYYKDASNSSLNDVFASIATTEMTGGAEYKLEKTTTTVIDVVSPAFKLPDGADGSKITLQVAKCKGVQSTETDGSYVFTFYDPLTKEATKELFPEIKAAVGVLEKTKVGDKTVVEFKEQKDGKAVSITGFGFSDNWVGPRTQGSETSYDGYKLIISFPIEIDPSNPGGATQNTNTEDSGIYTRENPDAPWEQIGGFDIPTVKIPNIIVIKNGLKKGDSAVFNVYKVESDGTESQFPIMLVATCTEDGKPAIAKTKIQKVGRYRVEETSWSWAYNTTRVGEYDKEDSSSITDEQWHEKGFGIDGESGYIAQKPFKLGTEVPETGTSIIRNVNDFTEDENENLGYKGTLFIFTNESKTGTPAHAETNNNNIFFKCK